MTIACLLLGGIFALLMILINKIDTSIELIYNRLNIDNEIWGSDKNV